MSIFIATNCVEHAFNRFLVRSWTDTNPYIAQCQYEGTGPGRDIPHFFYKSDQVISIVESWFENPGGPIDHMDPYEGPIEELPKQMQKHFNKSRYKKSLKITSQALEARILRCTSSDEFDRIQYNIA